MTVNMPKLGPASNMDKSAASRHFARAEVGDLRPPFLDGTSGLKSGRAEKLKLGKQEAEIE